MKALMMKITVAVVAGVVPTLVAGCMGIIGSPGGSDQEPGPMGRTSPRPGMIDPNVPPPECDGICLGDNRLTRLTRDAYLRSVEGAFGQAVDLDPGVLPPDGVAAEHFASNEGSSTIEATAAAYLSAAEQLAESLAPGISLDCDPSECGRELFSTYAPALFRREVDASWSDAYAQLYADTHADEGHVAALELTLTTLLQSPYLIYRIEPVADDSIGRLDGRALATRLSLFLWRDAPDAELRRAAETDELDGPEGIRAQVERMLADPRADASLAHFHDEWLGLDALEVSEDLSDALRGETSAFVVDAFRSDSTAAQLFTSPNASIESTLANHYGIAGGESVALPGRVGLLTHGSVLAAHGGPGLSRPIHRGVFLFTDAICNGIADPPADVNLAEVNEAADALGPDVTLREKVEAVTGGGACAGCHQVLNPPGFALEAFDIDGRYQPEGADTTGVMQTAAGEVSFSDHRELIEGLLDNRSIQTCYTIQWFRYALGREDTDEDARAVWEIYQAFQDAGFSLEELLLQIATSDSFTHRRAPEPVAAGVCSP